MNQFNVMCEMNIADAVKVALTNSTPTIQPDSNMGGFGNIAADKAIQFKKCDCGAIEIIMSEMSVKLPGPVAMALCEYLNKCQGENSNG
jgi:hypothetical protein